MKPWVDVLNTATHNGRFVTGQFAGAVSSNPDKTLPPYGDPRCQLQQVKTNLRVDCLPLVYHVRGEDVHVGGRNHWPVTIQRALPQLMAAGEAGHMLHLGMAGNGPHGTVRGLWEGKISDSQLHAIRAEWYEFGVVAEALAIMGYPVAISLMHELNAGSHYWYGCPRGSQKTHTSEQIIERGQWQSRVYILIVDYLRNTFKHLDQAAFMHAITTKGETSRASCWPGNEYVDIVAMSAYGTHYPLEDGPDCNKFPQRQEVHIAEAVQFAYDNGYPRPYMQEWGPQKSEKMNGFKPNREPKATTYNNLDVLGGRTSGGTRWSGGYRYEAVFAENDSAVRLMTDDRAITLAA